MIVIIGLQNIKRHVQTNYKMSSLKLSSFTPLNSQTKKKVITIWKTIYDSNDSLQFRNPVDWKGMGLLDYLKYVQKPMDLNTISRKLRQDKFRTVENVLDDIQLIFDNCKVYNAPGSKWIYNLADKLEKSFIKMIQNFIPKIVQNNLKSKIHPNFTKAKQPQPAQDLMEEEIPFFIEEVCYHDKIKFTDKLAHINSENLEAIVKKIFQKNPNAVKIFPPQQQQPQAPLENQAPIKPQDIPQSNLENIENLQQPKQILQQVIEQNNPENIVESKPQQTKNSQPIQMEPEEAPKLRGRRSNTVRNTRNGKKQTQKTSEPKISLDQMEVGTKAQIFIDDLNFESFEELMKMLEGMVQEKDKVMKKIKLD